MYRAGPAREPSEAGHAETRLRAAFCEGLRYRNRCLSQPPHALSEFRAPRVWGHFSTSVTLTTGSKDEPKCITCVLHFTRVFSHEGKKHSKK